MPERDQALGGMHLAVPVCCLLLDARLVIEPSDHLGRAVIPCHDRLANQRFAGTALLLLRRPAQIAGFGDLQELLRRGYDAVDTTGSVEEFLNLVVSREKRILEALCWWRRCSKSAISGICMFDSPSSKRCKRDCQRPALERRTGDHAPTSTTTQYDCMIARSLQPRPRRIFSTTGSIRSRARYASGSEDAPKRTGRRCCSRSGSAMFPMAGMRRAPFCSIAKRPDSYVIG